jgi:hypothetical protein
MHSLQSDQSLHAQVSLQVRVRVWVPSPQRPHGIVSVPTTSATHSPIPVQVPSFAQRPSSPQRCACWPHMLHRTVWP